MVVRRERNEDLKPGDMVVPSGKNRLDPGVFIVIDAVDMYGITQLIRMVDSNGVTCEALNVELKKI